MPEPDPPDVDDIDEPKTPGDAGNRFQVIPLALAMIAKIYRVSRCVDLSLTIVEPKKLEGRRCNSGQSGMEKSLAARA